MTSTMLPDLSLIALFILWQTGSIRGESKCPSGWLPDKYHINCYSTLDNVRLDWNDARDACLQNRSLLAPMRDSRDIEEAQYIRRAQGSEGDQHWIDSKQPFRPLLFPPMDVIDNKPSKDCVLMRENNEGLLLVNCWNKKYHMCEKVSGSNTTCPTGWVPYQGNPQLGDPSVCIKSFKDSHITFDGATSACLQHDGVLAMPRTQDKYKTMQGARGVSSSLFWVGVRRLPTTDVLEFIDGTKISKDEEWSPFQVLDVKQIWRGMVMDYFKKGARAVNHEHTYRYMCQKKTESSKQCSEGWQFYGGNSILGDPSVCLKTFGATYATQNGAYNICRRYNGSLALATTEAKFKGMQDARGNRYYAHWFGGRVPPSSNLLDLSDGSKTPMRPDWGSPFEVFANNEKKDCVFMRYWDEGLRYGACSMKRMFSCEIEPSADSKCPTGWKLYEGYRNANDPSVCIKSFGHAYRSVVDAISMCNVYGGFIAMPKSRAKYRAIQDTRALTTYDHWIGIRRSPSSGLMEFIDGTKIPTAIEWSPLYVLDDNPYTRCFSMRSYNYGLRAEDCGHEKAFACEKAPGRGGCDGGWSFYYGIPELGDPAVCIKAFGKPLRSYPMAVSHCLIGGWVIAMPKTFTKYKAIQRARADQAWEIWVGILRWRQPDIMEYFDRSELPSCRFLAPYNEGISPYESCLVKKPFVCKKKAERVTG